MQKWIQGIANHFFPVLTKSNPVRFLEVRILEFCLPSFLGQYMHEILELRKRCIDKTVHSNS